MGGEIVTVHVGQAGVQISHALWELVCVEHGIIANGQKTLEATQQSVQETGREYVFREVLRDKFVPRALLVDLEPSVIDEIRTGAYRELWHPFQLINGKEDAASNFARGYYSQSRFEINDVLDRVRILVEQCDNVTCFKLLYAVNGGTGSGLTSALCERYLMIELVRAVFEDTNQLLSVSADRRAYISCALLFCGATTPLEAMNAVALMKGDQMSRARFVDWCPTGFKIGVNFAPPVQATEHNTVALKNASLTMIAGNLSIRDLWTGVGRRFDQLYEKRAYVHRYVAEGMEEGEFTLAREHIQQLVEDYEAIAKDAEGAVYDTSINHSQKEMNKSVVRATPRIKRSPHNPMDVNVNQAATLDDQNSLRTSENNEDNILLDTNQHHSDSINVDGANVSRLKCNWNMNVIRREWGAGTCARRGGVAQQQFHPSLKRRLCFPEISDNTVLPGRFQA
ncbi:hypothetical protein P879_02680 [Paragonimus westermani]|uniref:Tubulin/FtsZ GTPase domain-containing protein n=1 Tax=Paragonimus westermani TaxID=34504 RepID=A0A8T0DP80_9TREM|nr:hypothetical protein P879_02680 [Paragonimus westermani]